MTPAPVTARPRAQRRLARAVLPVQRAVTPEDVARLVAGRKDLILERIAS